jgi:hypothetical protein
LRQFRLQRNLWHDASGLRCEEGIMKQCIVLFFFLLICATPLFSEDKSPITVKDSSANNGVVLVNINDSGKAFELQCNQSAPHCFPPQAGSYWMVRLPKNHGLYDCANVDLYAQSANTGNPDDVLGEYCINEQ